MKQTLTEYGQTMRKLFFNITKIIESFFLEIMIFLKYLSLYYAIGKKKI